MQSFTRFLYQGRIASGDYLYDGYGYLLKVQNFNAENA